MIPKILHFVWVGDDAKRPTACIQSWCDLNPDYEVRVWSNADLERGGPWINADHMADMATREWCGVADLMRYEILYHHGGVALDADSLCIRPLEDWLLEPEVFTCWSNEIYHNQLLANGILGATPEHPFIAKVIMDIHDRPSVIDDRAWKTTGNIPLTNAWRQSRYQVTVWPSHTFLPDFHSGPDYEGTGPVFARQLYGSTRNGLANQSRDAYDDLNENGMKPLGAR